MDKHKINLVQEGKFIQTRCFHFFMVVYNFWYYKFIALPELHVDTKLCIAQQLIATNQNVNEKAIRFYSSSIGNNIKFSYDSLKFHISN